ncbi:williams-beuren syndrome chromosomal region 27 [Fusarium longipes]|uniref:Williams-beuren syndrome chromosomal region 27 n=1 Tax=Fusarium longipes TaxID=694270 RepID=A0A395SXH9_9HYPO|nr:williams-beuren syndrome chromosomal region 27 [Fusarium longipes]
MIQTQRIILSKDVNMSQLERSLRSTSLSDTLSTYDEWANNYNQDVEREGYIAPKVAAESLVKHFGIQKISEARILDAGCGTGLVGEALLNLGAKHVDGIDLSPGMLEVAERTGLYETLRVANLAEQLEIASNIHDAVICVGTMTEGHVGPEALGEFVRITKPGGIIVCTVRESVWKPKGYQDKVNYLVQSGKAELVSNPEEHQRIGAGVYAHLVVLQIM